MQKRRDRDPISSLAAVTPYAGPIIKTVLKIGKYVYRTAKDAKSNPIACGELAGHIKEISRVIFSVSVVTPLSLTFMEAICNLGDSLHSCAIFLEKFNQKSKLIQTLLSIPYKKKIDKLSQRVTTYKDRLSFAILADIFDQLSNKGRPQNIGKYSWLADIEQETQEGLDYIMGFIRDANIEIPSNPAEQPQKQHLIKPQYGQAIFYNVPYGRPYPIY